VLSPRPIPLGYLVAPPILTLLIVLGYSQRNWRPRWQSRRAQKKKQAPVDRPLAGGLVSSRSALQRRVQTLLGQPSLEISGTVVDASTELPVAYARLELRKSGAGPSDLEADTTVRDLPPTLSVADPQGRFRFGTAAAPAGGHFDLVVVAPGYVSERIPVVLPHRGDLTDARIALVPVRVRIMELYRGIALDLLPRRDLWGHWTARELSRHVNVARPSVDPRLRPLVNLYERAYYGLGPAEEARLGEAQQLVAEVVPLLLAQEPRGSRPDER
jgi:hypothetical protein